MVEKLEGSDWNNIVALQESDGIYIYKLTKQGRLIWIAWNDNPQKRQITISGVRANQVIITKAVPEYKTGQNVKSYAKAFATQKKEIQDGRISMVLGKIPVFVETQ